MKTYRYFGPTTGAQLADGREVLLIKGRTFELDPADPALVNHFHWNRLVEVPSPPKRGAKKAAADPAPVPVEPPETPSPEGGQS